MAAGISTALTARHMIAPRIAIHTPAPACTPLPLTMLQFWNSRHRAITATAINEKITSMNSLSLPVGLGMMTDAVFNKSRAAPMMDTIQGMDFSQSFVVLRLLMSKPVLLTVPNVPHV